MFKVLLAPGAQRAYQVRVVHFFHETQDYLMTLQTESPDP